MEYFSIARQRGGKWRWFEPGESIPSYFSEVRRAPQNVEDLARKMLDEDASGEIMNATADRMRAALDGIT